MATPQHIAALRARIRQGEFETDRRRMTGPPEKYLESFCNLESLTQQLDQLLRSSSTDQPTDAGSRRRFS